MLRTMSKPPLQRSEPTLRDPDGMRPPSPAHIVIPPPRQRRGMGWGAGFLMGVFFLAVLLLGGWVALEWFIFPALDASAGKVATAPIVQGGQQNPALSDSSLRTGSALTPVRPPKDVPEVIVPLPPKAPPPAPAPVVPAPVAPSASPAPVQATTPPAAPTAAPPAVAGSGDETATVGGSGISLRAGPAGTEAVVATRGRGSVLHVFGRQNGWVQLGDTQPIGWGWNGLLTSSAAPGASPAAPGTSP